MKARQAKGLDDDISLLAARTSAPTFTKWREQVWRSERGVATHIEVYDAATLTNVHLARWQRLLETSPIESPFLSPSFAVALARHRSSVKVVAFREGDQYVGFLPVDVLGLRAQAVGMKFADFQGGVFQAGTQVRALTLLRAIGVQSYHFDHQLLSEPFCKSAVRRIHSPYLDLTHGYSHYSQSLRDRGSSVVSQLNRKRRKLEREVGEVRLELNSNCPELLDWIIREKREQRKRTRTFDVLQFDWVVQALKELRPVNKPAFGAVTTALFAGDRLAAAHFGLRTSTVLHYWFPAYDHELSKYSPGLILLLETARQYAERGIRRLDLGRGDERYKQRLANGTTTILQGAIDLNPVRHLARRCLHSGINAARQAWFAEILKPPFRALKNVSFRRSMRPNQ